MGEESLTLKVAEALQDEVGYGRGRLDTVTRNELGLSIGDIVEIHGRRRDPTVAIVWRARTEDEGKGIIRVDGLIRNNAKVNLGDKVEVKKAQVKPAQKVVLAPMMDQSGRVQFGPGIEEVILRGLNFGLETIGVAKSAPRSNKSFCISDITLTFFLEIACLTTPKIEFNSSTDP